jgi:Amt family ammonium transporter
MWFQILGALFIIAWNAVVTSLICVLISRIVDLRMKEEELDIGDDAVHGEEAYALWGDGEKTPASFRRHMRIPSIGRRQK